MRRLSTHVRCMPCNAGAHTDHTICRTRKISLTGRHRHWRRRRATAGRILHWLRVRRCDGSVRCFPKPGWKVTNEGVLVRAATLQTPADPVGLVAPPTQPPTRHRFELHLTGPGHHVSDITGDNAVTGVDASLALAACSVFAAPRIDASGSSSSAVPAQRSLR